VDLTPEAGAGGEAETNGITAGDTTADGSVPGGIEIAVPDPCLVVLIGAAGSGKTTLARRLVPAAQILSSDAFRGIVSGDDSDQGATKLAFAILHREL